MNFLWCSYHDNADCLRKIKSFNMFQSLVAFSSYAPPHCCTSPAKCSDASRTSTTEEEGMEQKENYSCCWVTTGGTTLWSLYFWDQQWLANFQMQHHTFNRLCRKRRQLLHHQNMPNHCRGKINKVKGEKDIWICFLFILYNDTSTTKYYVFQCLQSR